jgi:hypothetical protein
MRELKVLQPNAQAAYKVADSNGKALLENLFGKEHLVLDLAAWEAYIIPRIGSFEDACREAGANPAAEIFTEGEPDVIAYQRGKLVCDVLNGPFLDDMKDPGKGKFYAWMDKTASGFRFTVTHYDNTFTHSTAGSRLRLCSSKLAKHFAVTFTDMMTPFWWNS